MQRPMPTNLLRLFVCCLYLAQPAFADSDLPVPDPAASKPTDLGRYRIAYTSTLEPLAINRMHAWVIRVADADGKPTENAELTLSGGMPAHDHGLPTAPRATAYMGRGNYLIEGMKFHMGGAWEVEVAVSGPQGTDTLTLQLDL